MLIPCSQCIQSLTTYGESLISMVFVRLFHVPSVFNLKEFLAIRRAISLTRRSFYFVEITTGETRHIQEIYIDGPSMHHCPHF